MTLIMIEDNQGDVRLIKELLSGGYSIDVAETLADGIDKLQTNNYNCLLLDLNLPDSAGIETFNKIASNKFDLPIVILTGIHDVDLAVHAVRHGAQDYLEKNVLTKNELSKCISYSVERHAYIRSQLNQLVLIKRHLESIDKNIDKIVLTQEAILHKIDSQS
jgi:FixJ family two-component response regulator